MFIRIIELSINKKKFTATLLQELIENLRYIEENKHYQMDKGTRVGFPLMSRRKGLKINMEPTF